MGRPARGQGPRGRRCAYHCASHSPVSPLIGRGGWQVCLRGRRPCRLHCIQALALGPVRRPACQDANTLGCHGTREGWSNRPFAYMLSGSAAVLLTPGEYTCMARNPTWWARLRRRSPNSPWDSALRASWSPGERPSDHAAAPQRRGWKCSIEEIRVRRIINEVIFVKDNLTFSVWCKTFIDLTS